MNAIDRRVSVRQYTADPVTNDEVCHILQAAMAAPSAGNQRPWEFYAVRDMEVRRMLAESSMYAGPCGRAPLAIAFCLRANTRFPEEAPQDMAACVENAWLAATELNLGAVWMSVFPHTDRMERVSQALQLHDGLLPFALMAVGHPATESNPMGMSRYEEERIHWV